MAYKDFKDYIQTNYGKLLNNEIQAFVDESHDGLGFHSNNVLSILKQKVANIEVMSISCRDDVGPLINIDVHTKADIVLKGLGKADYEADRKKRWFTVSLRAELKNGLHKVEALHVEEYYHGSLDKEDALDSYMIPYISTDQLEDIADDFTEFCCGSEVYDGYHSPLKKMLNELQLTWHIADLPEGEMGRMYFRSGKAEIEKYTNYPFGRYYHEEKVEPGTMLISQDFYFINGYGSRSDTIAHEMVHWEKHQKFFEILCLLNNDEKTLYCDSKPVSTPEKLEGVAKARWWAEWQANALAPRFLMPRRIFNDYFPKMIEEQRTFDHVNEGQVMERALRQIAAVFEVSVFEAKLRAIQLGYKQAEGAFIYLKKHHLPPFTFKEDSLGNYESFILSSKNGKHLYNTNSIFAELIDSERFVYTGFVVCINNPLYVYQTDDKEYPQGYALTDYALEHIDECCLKFKREYSISNQFSEYYNDCYLCKDVNSSAFIERQKIEDIEEQDAIEKEKELNKINEEAERVSSILAALPTSFYGTFDAHMKRVKRENGKKMTNQEIALRTGLSDVYIGKLRKGSENPSPEVVFALCAALHLHPMFSDDMVRKAMGNYPSSKYGGFAYYLLHDQFTESLSLINEKLEKYKYPTWGDAKKIV